MYLRRSTPNDPRLARLLSHESGSRRPVAQKKRMAHMPLRMHPLPHKPSLFPLHRSFGVAARADTSHSRRNDIAHRGSSFFLSLHVPLYVLLCLFPLQWRASEASAVLAANPRHPDSERGWRPEELQLTMAVIILPI